MGIALISSIDPIFIITLQHIGKLVFLWIAIVQGYKIEAEIVFVVLQVNVVNTVNLDSQEQLVEMEMMVHQDSLVEMVMMANQDKWELQVNVDKLEHLDNKVHQDIKVLLAHLEEMNLMGNQDSKVLQAKLENQDSRVLLEIGVHLDRPEEMDLMVSLESQAGSDLEAFEQLCAGWPLVRECHMLYGEIDFLLKCVAPNLLTFQTFLTDDLTATENVANVRTSLQIRSAKDEPSVPFEYSDHLAAENV
jgi:DNA-binding Lrp family transcriptional regulator